jgi:hypothetical protein
MNSTQLYMVKTISHKSRLQCLNKVVTTIHKCLGLKDGRYTNDELVELLSSEESHEKLKRNVCAMDCLIIDEISMLSLKMIVLIILSHYPAIW